MAGQKVGEANPLRLRTVRKSPAVLVEQNIVVIDDIDLGMGREIPTNRREGARLEKIIRIQIAKDLTRSGAKARSDGIIHAPIAVRLDELYRRLPCPLRVRIPFNYLYRPIR